VHLPGTGKLGGRRGGYQTEWTLNVAHQPLAQPLARLLPSISKQNSHGRATAAPLIVGLFHR